MKRKFDSFPAKTITFLLLILLASPTIATPAKNKKNKGRKPNTLQAFSPDPDFPAEEMEQMGLDVNGPTTGDEVGEIFPSTREQMFAQSGVAEYVKNWDPMEKDLLILKLKHMTVERIIANTESPASAIPHTLLSRLQELVKRQVKNEKRD